MSYLHTGTGDHHDAQHESHHPKAKPYHVAAVQKHENIRSKRPPGNVVDAVVVVVFVSSGMGKAKRGVQAIMTTGTK